MQIPPLRLILTISLVLMVSSVLIACDASKDLKATIDAFNESESYAFNTEMRDVYTSRTVDITYRVDGRKEYVQFMDQEYYQLFEDGTMYRYFQDEAGAWRREAIPETSPEDALFLDENIVRPGNIRFSWFEEGEDGYYVIKDESKASMFKDLSEEVTYAAIKKKDERLEFVYRLSNAGAPLEYTFLIEGFDETTVDLPDIEEGLE